MGLPGEIRAALFGTIAPSRRTSANIPKYDREKIVKKSQNFLCIFSCMQYNTHVRERTMCLAQDFVNRENKKHTNLANNIIL